MAARISDRPSDTNDIDALIDANQSASLEAGSKQEVRGMSMQGKKKIVYTAITAGYDQLRPVAVIDPDIDYIVYTDVSPGHVPPPWTVRSTRPTIRNPRLTSRWYKLLPHRHLPDGAHSLWIDANYEIVTSLSVLFDLLAGTQLAVQAHPLRFCIYDEAEVVKRRAMEHPEIVDIQMAHYRRLGYPILNGLIEANILFRAHGNQRVRTVMEDWWQQVETFSHRDQLAANFVFWRHSFDYATVPWKSQKAPWLRRHPHLKKESYIGEESAEILRDHLSRAVAFAAQFSN